MNYLKISFIVQGFILLLISLNTSFTHSLSTEEQKNIKLLVLIIASDDLPVYVELQKIWRSYMHRDPEHVEAYFIKGNNNLSTAYEIDNDIIWSKTPESLMPGIINKTILSMEAMLPRLEEFDYVLRTNLSSFYIFPRLLTFLKDKPRDKFYCAVPIIEGHGSGAGFLMSTDVVKLLVANKNFFWNSTSLIDDMLIGSFLKRNSIYLLPHNRMNFITLETWNLYHDKIPDDIFQFRVKNNYPHLRITDEVYIQKQLLQKFYS